MSRVKLCRVKAIAVALSFASALLTLPHQATAQGSGSSTYRVGPKDLLTIEVVGVAELSVDRRVSEEGLIELPVIGAVNVNDLTEAEIRAKLTTLIESRYLQDKAATVVVTVKDFQSRPISVIGAVKQPGPLKFPGRWRLLEVLTAAGGLAADHGDTIYVLRTASNGLSDQVPIAVSDLLLTANPRANIPIFANDLINVPAASTVTVFIVGEVKSPGALSLKSNERITILTALARAGGLTDRAAKGLVIRRQLDGREQEIEVDAKRVLSGRDADVKLIGGDVVVVKEAFF